MGMVEYRSMPNGRPVSTIGIGAVHWHEMDEEETVKIIDYAENCGLNLLDFAMAYDTPLATLGKALSRRRDAFVYQLHLGLTFPDGQYERTRDVVQAKAAFENQLHMLGTEYADTGYIHCVDEAEDFDDVFSKGLYEYAVRLKEHGIIRQLGFATHTIDIAEKFLSAGGFDMCLFSINPAYDFDPVANLAFEGLNAPDDISENASRRRYAFYDECSRKGIGITVMKAYGGGTLLDATSPLGRPMSPVQCIHYALDRPAVLSVIAGINSLQQLEEAVRYYNASEMERDYSWIKELRPASMRGKCTYCNHCLPCPSCIDIGAVQKYLDLYSAGDDLAKEHYMCLSKKADACIQCGACEKKCPFGVKVMEKMHSASESFSTTQ